MHLGSPVTCRTALFWCPLMPSVPPFCARYLVSSGVRQMWPLCGQSDEAPAFVRTTLGARTQPVSLLPHWQIYIRIKDDEWNVYRRYTEFRALHHQLQSTFPQVRAYSFPPKKAIGNKVCIQGPRHYCTLVCPQRLHSPQKTCNVRKNSGESSHLREGQSSCGWVSLISS